MKLMKLATIVVAGVLVFGGLGRKPVPPARRAARKQRRVFLDIGGQLSRCQISPGDKCIYSGVIDSESKKCIEGRKVKMYAYINSGTGSSCSWTPAPCRSTGVSAEWASRRPAAAPLLGELPAA